MSAQANSDFLSFISDKTVELAFDNGEIHTVTFEENRLGVLTGIYTDENGKNVKGISLSFIRSGWGEEYLRLYKNRTAPMGTYKYEMLVFLPTVIATGETRTYVDARWGYYKKPVVHISN